VVEHPAEATVADILDESAARITAMISSSADSSGIAKPADATCIEP
jgi:hypothetical protein